MTSEPNITPPGEETTDRPTPSLSEQARGLPPYVASMNPAQQEAVLATEGPVLVLAGAGTGKTRVLTTRLAYILQTQMAWPGQILAVTFTNKAAREMRDRIGKFIGGVVDGMQWLGTFHSVAAQILRRHAELVGLKSNFTILDTDDQIRLLKQLLEAANIDDKRWNARLLAGLIDGWKNKGLTPDRVPLGESQSFAEGKGAEFYKEYQHRLKVLNAADFGDLLLECITLFQRNPEVLAEYQRRFKYILVDEYQDTNVAQYLWLRLLAQEHKNVCCVGDDDQSIYGWRGAEVDNILRFEKDFPGAKVVRLEQNYRSTPHILAAASKLISYNDGRLGKTLWTDEADGEKVYVRGVWDGEEEARVIGDDIESYQSKGRSLNDMAILVRASMQMRLIEERLINLGIPYKVFGGPRFFERAEIRDAIAYFRVVMNPDDSLAFERIINKPKRKLGKTTVQKIHTAARAQNISLFRAAAQMTETDELTSGTKTILRTLLTSFARWAKELDSLPHTEVAEIILDESGYTEMWQNDKSADAPGKLENLQELVRSMDQFEDMAGFLEHVSLVLEVNQAENDDKVSLMTLHSAKGLEFPIVFLAGWEEGLFPSDRSVNETGLRGLEEERRLAHVGITRAMEVAKISFAANRMIFGKWNSSLPSRFIDELPPEHVEVMSDNGLYSGHMGMRDNASSFDRDAQDFGSTYDSPGWRRARSKKGPVTIEAKAESSSSDESEFSIGTRIFHQKFGYGKVKRVEGNKLTIDFEKTGQKKVISSFVESA